MTPQEQQLLASLCQRVNQTQLPEKDPDAENLLGHELGANPDALYIMAQTVLVQDIALQQARAQVTQLQQQVQQARQQPAHATSFLGRLLGEREPVQQPTPPPSQQMQPPPYQPVPAYQAPPAQYAQPQYSQSQYVGMPAGQPSFLRGAMQTAAGVAAGALAFEGVESILHGFGHGGYGPGFGMGGFGMGPGMGMGGGFQRPIEENVVNNYYDAPGQPGSMGGGEQRFETGGNEPRFHESADQAGNQTLQDQGFQDQSGAQFTDASYNTGADETAGTYDQGNLDPGMDNASAAADTSVDDVQIDDSGSGFDDGGGFDSGGGDGF